ncbi:MAG TPA: glutaredoxin domain-containing protein, partial [Polyangiales bacterium]
LGLPLWLAVAPPTELSPSRLDRALEFWLVLGLAMLLVYGFLPLLPRRGLRRQDHYPRYLRLAQRIAPSSALGPVLLRVGEQALERQAADGEILRVEWADVRGVLACPRLLTLRLRDPRRVLAVPVRAFADSDAVAAFRSKLEARAGVTSVEVGFDLAPIRPPSMRAWLARARLPMLATGLTLTLVLFAQLTLLPWLRSPLRHNPAGAVVVYGTDWCPACARLRTCLGQSGIPFDDRDVERSASARREWGSVGGRAVPVVLVGHEVVFGGAGRELTRVMREAGHQLSCADDGDPR